MFSGGALPLLKQFLEERQVGLTVSMVISMYKNITTYLVSELFVYVPGCSSAAEGCNWQLHQVPVFHVSYLRLWHTTNSYHHGYLSLHDTGDPCTLKKFLEDLMSADCSHT